MRFPRTPGIYCVLAGVFALAAGKSFDCGAPGVGFGLMFCVLLAMCGISVTFLRREDDDYQPRRRPR
jgi:hypothetical protein